MNTLDCIKSRRSIRKYKPEKIARETVKELVEYAKWAPSWNNTKAVRYIAIDNEAMLKHISENLVAPENVHIVANAPLLFVLSIVRGRAGYERDGSTSTAKGDTWQMFDAGVACQTLCLAAEDMGIGTVIMASFDEGGVAEYAGVPEDELIIALVAAGYPDEEPKAPRRKLVDEILRFK